MLYAAEGHKPSALIQKFNIWQKKKGNYNVTTILKDLTFL